MLSTDVIIEFNDYHFSIDYVIIIAFYVNHFNQIFFMKVHKL